MTEAEIDNPVTEVYGPGRRSYPDSDDYDSFDYDDAESWTAFTAAGRRSVGWLTGDDED
jgi:hypothetical protein